MFGIKEFSIDFLSSSQAVIWPVLILLILLALYLYQRTNPPISLLKKNIFAGLRIIALLALMTALLEPVISFSTESERSRKVAVILDRSQSMEKEENEKTRLSRADSLLSSRPYENLKNNTDMQWYYFGENLSQNLKEVVKSQTSLGDILNNLQISELSAPSDYWLLLSDGRSNSGQQVEKAIENLQTKVFTINVGGESENFDIGITDVEFNPVIFVGEPTEIKVKLNWQQAMGRNLKVELQENNKTVAFGQFMINQEYGFGEISLNYTADKPEQKIVHVSIPVSDNEENSQNNRYSFSIKVLKSKLEVLLVASEPDYETGFLKRFFAQTDKYNISIVVPSAPAGNLTVLFPSQQTEINKYDLIVFQDPALDLLNSHSLIIKSYLADKGGSIWFLTGENFAFGATPIWLKELMPFYLSKPEEIVYESFHAVPSEDQLIHPAVRIADNQTLIRKQWEELPPFQFYLPCDITDPNGIILAYKNVNRSVKHPLLGYRRIGPGKVFVTSAFPFWNWGFVSLGLGQDDASYGIFLEGVASWLTVKDDFDPIRVMPQKEVYNRGEKIKFDGYAYDLGYRPIPDVSGIVSVESMEENSIREIDLLSIGDGRYQAEFFNLKPGKYSYKGRFEKDSRILKENQGEFLVESYSLEQFDQRSDPATLQAIADRTGGAYYTYKDFDKAVALIDMSTVLESKKNELSIWNKTWLLLLFIAALSIEWLLRKTNQLL